MEKETITVYVNDRPKKMYRGLRVKNAIGVRWTQRVKAHRAEVRDADGNRVEVDGALYDGARLLVAPLDAQKFADDVQRRA